MSDLRIAFLGDVVGSSGRRAVAHAWPKLRDLHGVHALIVNGENARNGSGCSPDNYRELRRSGADAVTLGDHAYKDRAILETLEDPLQPISRPANLSAGAPGKRIIQLELPEKAPKAPPVYVLTVLGRLFMSMPSNSPFECIDREIGAIAEREAMVIVEIHAEATSEKQAVAYHCLERWTRDDGPRVVAVVGTHTHVQTADARLIDHTLAAITDLGMCGPHRSVIGRDIRATLSAMVQQSPSALDVADGDNRACGVIVRIDARHRRAAGIEPVNIAVPE
ncbi:MAG TPA: TIGR00282 family metallophosphoesterase [Phycisphaerales bacterium]|nr:TIGR00282 family metallophosphoesterase [Phycisphaerales bacterium]